MRKTDMSYLGGGFSPLRFWAFNGGMMVVWLALHMLQMFAIIGVGYIFVIDPVNVTASVTGQLGCAFVNLMYGLSVLALAIFIIMAWFCGNIYILRKEIYELVKWYFRWGDL